MPPDRNDLPLPIVTLRLILNLPKPGERTGLELLPPLDLSLR